MTTPLPYRNPSLPVENRVNDLISRMTLEEKVLQLMMITPEHFPDGDPRVAGSYLHVRTSKAAAVIDSGVNSRLGIPVLIAEDCIHGHSFWKGATIFPTQLALGCSWSPELLEKVARVTALEVTATGTHWTFSPVLCLTRDLRWGRVGETFGEDPHLIGELASAMVKGYQGKGLDDPEGILATAKHFAGYSETQGGRDASEADISPRKLRSFFLPPFEKAARDGAMTFMTGYQSMEGVPTTANRWLLRDVLKGEWGFQGVLVTDWDNVGRLVKEQKICANYKEAAAVAVKSGNDISMTTVEFYQGALDAVRDGLLTEADLDEPVRRVLGLKFRMGLFENPRRADPSKIGDVIARPEHRALNLESARKSIVLLQNKGILPLAPGGLRQIAVIGPNADNDLEQLGDWSLGASQYPANYGKQPRECTATVLDGLRNTAPEGCRVVHAEGGTTVSLDPGAVESAAALAARSDVAIVVIGDSLDYVGECRSTATLELQGSQLALLEALQATGTPIIVVLINSKPLVLPPAVQNVAAIIEAFNPGMEGGTAIAEIIWGTVNPSGKLCVSFPRHVGQQPVVYSQVRGQHGKSYADLTQEPLFRFGFGLSYTNYRYEQLRVLTPKMSVGQPVELEVDVTNTGDRAGEEIVQVYVSDEVTSATWVDRQLKAFRRIELQPGEKATVRFSLPFEAFSIVNAKGERVVEPGRFELFAGSSSRDLDLLKEACVLEA